MSEEQVESSEVVEQAEETTNESAEPKAVEAKSAAVTKPVPPEIKAKQDAEKAKSKAQPKSVLAKAGDPEKAKDGEKPEGSTDEKVVPEKYELTLPEGASIDAELMPVFEEALKGERVSADGANKLAELHLKGVESAITKFQENAEAEAVAQDEKWETELKTEFGSRFQEELSYVAKVRDTFFSKETMELFDAKHIGSNPSLLKDLIKIGKQISESKIVEGGSHQGGGADASKMYPSMNK